MIDVPIQVKDALREGRLRKNYRFQVLNDDGTVDFTIDNDNLVSESVNIDERMCSGDKIEYGLCEGSSLEFQYFGKENITGRQLKVFVDVEYGESTPYAIPMGYFTVKNCSRQASTGIIKAVCYNKLQSDYLDQKANLIVAEQFASTTSLKIGALIRLMLKDYRIDANRQNVEPVAPVEPGGGGLPYTYPDIYCGASLSLYPQQYGIDSPLNSYVYSTGAWKFATHSRMMNFEEEDEELFIEFKKGSFVNLERAVYNFLKEVLDAAKLKDGNGNIVTGQQILDDICANSNFAHIIGIGSTLGVGPYSNYYYSTIQWEYEVEHGLQHKVRGNSNDAIATMTSARIIMPFNYGLYTGDDPEMLLSSIAYSFDGTEHGVQGVDETHGSYQYYLDSALILSEVEDAPFLYFDGSVYPTNYDIVALYWSAYVVDTDGIDATPVTLADLPDFTLRDLQAAVYESGCQFGQLDRETDLFSGVELNRSRLLPADTLYPDNALYPSGAQESAFRSQYSKLWADEGNVRKWRYLIITYKGLDENQQEKDFTLQRTVNADGTDDYNCSDNWLFRNLIWTATDIGSYADAMVAKMQDITWFPFEMWCAGLPYLETGDEIEIPLGEATYTSYILQRQLKGIQNLQDTYINGTLDIF